MNVGVKGADVSSHGVEESSPGNDILYSELSLDILTVAMSVVPVLQNTPQSTSSLAPQVNLKRLSDTNISQHCWQPQLIKISIEHDEGSSDTKDYATDENMEQDGHDSALK